MRTKPAELSISTPRDVRLSAAGRLVIGLAVLLTVGALPAFLLLLDKREQTHRLAQQFEREAVQTEARVLTVGRPSGDDGDRKVAYRYQTSDGVPYDGQVRLKRRERPDLKPSDTLRIRYLGAKSWAEGRAPERMPEPVLLLPLALLIGAGALVFIVRRQQSLLGEGRLSEATVTGAKKVDHGHGKQWRVNYEFIALSGARITSHFDTTKNPPATGTKLTIIYDRDRPARAARYRLPVVGPLA
jgi:hypothetical protein